MTSATTPPAIWPSSTEEADRPFFVAARKIRAAATAITSLMAKVPGT